MTWLRFDDNFPDHPKVLSVSDAAFRLHIRSICYAARHLTDGHVSSAALQSLSRKSSLSSELVAAGLWETEKDGFLVHDYLQYQPSRAEVQEKREGDRERKRQDGIRSGSARKVAGIR